MNKPDANETLEKCKATVEVSKEYYKKECERLFKENYSMKIIIQLLIEELGRVKHYE